MFRVKNEDIFPHNDDFVRDLWHVCNCLQLITKWRWQNSRKTVKLIQKLLTRQQGLEKYFRDAGSDQNTMRDSGKRKISRRETGFECYPGSGIHHNVVPCILRENLGSRLDLSKSMHGMRDIFNSLSGIWEIMTTQLHVLAANAIYQGESSCFSYQLSKLCTKWSG